MALIYRDELAANELLLRPQGLARPFQRLAPLLLYVECNLKSKKVVDLSTRRRIVFMFGVTSVRCFLNFWTTDQGDRPNPLRASDLDSIDHGRDCFDTQTKPHHRIDQDIPMHQARQTNGTPQRPFLFPKQQTRISTTRHVKAKGRCCLRSASWHACARSAKDHSVTGKYTRHFRSPWAYQKRAVDGSGPCQSSASDSQQVPNSARCDWRLLVLTAMNSGDAQLPATA